MSYSLLLFLYCLTRIKRFSLARIYKCLQGALHFQKLCPIVRFFDLQLYVIFLLQISYMIDQI